MDEDYDFASERVIDAAREWVRLHEGIVYFVAPGSMRQLAERDAAVAELRAAVAALPEADAVTDAGNYGLTVLERIRTKGGEVGTITGPAIIGTTDTVNAGPARLK